MSAQNVTTKITGNVLTITVNLDAATTASASGKTQVIASTRGNVKLDTPKGTIHLGLNLYRYAQ